jgi:hypothetical protein
LDAVEHMLEGELAVGVLADEAGARVMSGGGGVGRSLAADVQEGADVVARHVFTTGKKNRAGEAVGRAGEGMETDVLVESDEGNGSVRREECEHLFDGLGGI